MPNNSVNTYSLLFNQFRTIVPLPGYRAYAPGVSHAQALSTVYADLNWIRDGLLRAFRDRAVGPVHVGQVVNVIDEDATVCQAQVVDLIGDQIRMRLLPESPLWPLTSAHSGGWIASARVSDPVTPPGDTHGSATVIELSCI